MSKRKVVSWLFIITSFWMCTDDFSPGKSGGIHDTEDNEMVIVAKKLLEKNGNILSLPNFKKQQVRGIKTRNVSYSTDATPMWEQVRNARYGEEQIVMIPLRGKEEIRSHVYIERDGDYTYQFSKTFSRLVVRTKEESTVAHVMTYLPDAKYAESHVAELDTMGYSPGYIQFEGLVLVSSLNGTFLHGLLYSHGKIVAKLQMPEDHEHTTECTHEHETIRISLNLYSPLSTITRTAYNDGEEKYFCTICKKEYTDCECVIIDGKILYCDKCGAETFNCICDLSICQTCGEEPCTCHTNPNACQDCGAYPCECGGSNGKEENNGENGEKDENGEDNSEEGTQNKEVEMTEEEVRLINAALNLLKQLGIEISDTKIVKMLECRSNAQVSFDYTTILVCSKFFELAPKDQVSVLYHEFYHLNNDNRSWSKLDTEITFLATPPTDIKQCIRTMMIERDHANEFSQEHQELLYYTYVNLGIYYDATYYENEVNTYREEIAKIKDVTSVYDAERKYMLWVNETKLAKLNN